MSALFTRVIKEKINKVLSAYKPYFKFFNLSNSKYIVTTITLFPYLFVVYEIEINPEKRGIPKKRLRSEFCRSDNVDSEGSYGMWPGARDLRQVAKI